MAVKGLKNKIKFLNKYSIANQVSKQTWDIVLIKLKISSRRNKPVKRFKLSIWKREYLTNYQKLAKQVKLKVPQCR